MGLHAATLAPRHNLAPWRRRPSRQWTRPKPRTWSEERLLGAIPSLPRASLARITERMIDRMDEIDSDPDEGNGDELDGSDSHEEDCGLTSVNLMLGALEDDEDDEPDGCDAGDDEITGGVSPAYHHLRVPIDGMDTKGGSR